MSDVWCDNPVSASFRAFPICILTCLYQDAASVNLLHLFFVLVSTIRVVLLAFRMFVFAQNFRPSLWARVRLLLLAREIWAYAEAEMFNIVWINLKLSVFVALACAQYTLQSVLMHICFSIWVVIALYTTVYPRPQKPTLKPEWRFNGTCFSCTD